MLDSSQAAREELERWLWRQGYLDVPLGVETLGRWATVVAENIVEYDGGPPWYPDVYYLLSSNQGASWAQYDNDGILDHTVADEALCPEHPERCLVLIDRVNGRQWWAKLEIELFAGERSVDPEIAMADQWIRQSRNQEEKLRRMIAAWEIEGTWLDVPLQPNRYSQQIAELLADAAKEGRDPREMFVTAANKLHWRHEAPFRLSQVLGDEAVTALEGSE